MLLGVIGGVLSTSLVTNLTLGARISRIELRIESRLARIETLLGPHSFPRHEKE